MNQVNKAVVIYHDNCVDGFGSAWAFHMLKETTYEEVEYVPCTYGKVPDLDYFSKATDVYIVDFSFPRADLLIICASSKSVTVLDHHKTAKEVLAYWDDRPDNCIIEFDMERSGAGMTWDYFADHQARPLLINYIEDRDLWRFNLFASKNINAVIAITPKTFEAYSNLNSSIVRQGRQSIADIGVYLTRQHDLICEQIVEQARPITIFGSEDKEYHGLACNCTKQFSSEVGNLLALKGVFYGATYCSLKNGDVEWSLRSIGDNDVSEIAKIFGGGGHKNAAGFKVSLNLAEGVEPDRIELWKA